MPDGKSYNWIFDKTDLIEVFFFFFNICHKDLYDFV